MTLTVSVVIPTHKSGRFLAPAVRSALDSGVDEVILVANGFRQPPIDFPDYLLNDITLLTLNEANLPAARNAGLHHASGEFIVFLDHDDLIFPTKIKNMVPILEKDPTCGVIHSGWEFIDEDGDHIAYYESADFGPSPVKLLAQQTFAPMLAMLMRRNAVLDVGGFDTDFDGMGYDDWHLLWKLALKGWKFSHVSEISGAYRQSSHSSSLSRADTMMQCGTDVANRLEADAAHLDIDHDFNITRALVCIECASQAYRNKRDNLVRKTLGQGVEYWPELLTAPLFFNHLIAFASPLDQGHAVWALNPTFPAGKIRECYADIIKQFIPDSLRPKNGPAALEAWLEKKNDMAAA